MGAEQPEKRKIAFNLTFTTVLTFVFLMIAAMTAAYIWGVMTGRHLVEAPRPAAPVPESGVESGEAKAQAGILKPQDLDFVHALRGDARPAAAKAKPAPAEAPKAEAPPAAATPATPPVIPQPADVSYDYVFQVAALKNEQAADSLRERLEGRGLRTRLERSGRLYIVLALLRGDAARAAEVFQICKELRLGEPLERSKKPVSRP